MNGFFSSPVFKNLGKCVESYYCLQQFDIFFFLFSYYRSAADYMNTRNAFHGLDEGLNTLAPKFEPAKLSFQTRTKSLLDEDDYFRANLPPTYDMEPLPVDAFSFDEKIISTTATRGDLISESFPLRPPKKLLPEHFFIKEF